MHKSIMPNIRIKGYLFEYILLFAKGFITFVRNDSLLNGFYTKKSLIC